MNDDELTSSKLQIALNNYSDCLLNDNRCEFDYFEFPYLYLTDWEMYQYCSNGSNLLTEDICHNWFTYSMYRESDNRNINCTQKYSNNGNILYKCSKSNLNDLLTDVCAKYPYHQKCACVTGIKGINNKHFSFDIDPSKTYPTHCLYPPCSKANMNQSKQSSLGKPFLPESVLNNPNTCPSTICTIDMKGAKINIEGEGQIDISNYCSNFGEEDDDEEEYLFMIGEFKVTALYLVIGIIIFLLIILFIIIIILSVKKGNNKRLVIRKRNK